MDMKTSHRARRVLIVAGEASADRYGARLVSQLQLLHGTRALEFFGTGGDDMKKAGVHLFCHIRELAHIGPTEALSSLRTYYRTFRHLSSESSIRRPDVAILLDFPEFNLRLAKKMKRLGVTVIYYISPQIWAWRSGRLRTIQQCVDKMLVILPFEEDYYRKCGVDVEFVGHPLLEDFSPNYNREAFLSDLGLDPAARTVAILAGSRNREIDYILPILLRAAKFILKEIPAQFLISSAPTVEQSRIRKIMEDVLRGDSKEKLFRILKRNSKDILANADFALVKSGTSSLEAALVGTPFLITYRISSISWLIGSALIRSPMKGLVNLIAREKIVPELFQGEAKPQELARVALQYLESPEESAAMRVRLSKIREKLSMRCASETAAATVSSYL
jgi:lipid-A-disaccharide synthase